MNGNDVKVGAFISLRFLFISF